MIFRTLLIASFLCIFLGFQTNAQEDKTESPYVHVTSELGENFEQNKFPLISSNVDVKISGVIADVTIEQVYKNNSDVILNSEYVFPASSQAAVYAMEMELNGHITKAVVKEKTEAKQIFEEAKKEGKSASLLEQHRPNVFQMSLANLNPGDELKIRLKYTENIIPKDKQYEFVFPTLVGPRFTKELNESNKWAANPFTNSDAANLQGNEPKFHLNLNLSAGLPVNQALWANSLGAKVNFLSKTELVTSIDNSHKSSNKADFVFRYQLSGNAIESGLLVYEGEDENYFLYTIQPPTRPDQNARPPRDYIFIVDVSGSMEGFPIEVSKKLVMQLLNDLEEKDRFNILLFAGGRDMYSDELVPVTSDNIRKAQNFISKQYGSGGTDLLPALKEGLDMMDGDGRSTTFIIATDGFVTVEREAMDLIQDNLGKANFFPFGIGENHNRYIIEAMAHAGHSEPFVCMSESEALKQAELFRKLVTNPVLTDIKVKFDGIDAYDVIPKSIPDLFADKPIVVSGKFKKLNDFTASVKGQNAKGKFEQKIFTRVADSKKSENQALRYLWARNKIKLLSDYNRAMPDEETKQEIVQLGLAYNLLTEFTSFVAVDENPEPKRAKISAPSIPNSSGSVPEPHEWTLIIISILVLAYLVFARLFHK